MADRGNGGNTIPLLFPVHHMLGGRNGKSDVETIRFQLAGNVVPVAFKQRDNVPIFRGNIVLKSSDAVIAGGVDQAFDQPGADTFAAVIIIDDNGDLRGIFSG